MLTVNKTTQTRNKKLQFQKQTGATISKSYAITILMIRSFRKIKTINSGMNLWRCSFSDNTISIKHKPTIYQSKYLTKCSIAKLERHVNHVRKYYFSFYFVILSVLEPSEHQGRFQLHSKDVTHHVKYLNYHSHLMIVL